MTKVIIHLILIGLLQPFFPFFTDEQPDLATTPIGEKAITTTPDPELKAAALEVLKAKCNVCHKKKNPFKVFSLKNMDKHAKRIYKQVFVFKRMPKGDEVKLTDEEYQTLKDWLKSKNTF